MSVTFAPAVSCLLQSLHDIADTTPPYPDLPPEPDLPIILSDPQPDQFIKSTFEPESPVLAEPEFDTSPPENSLTSSPAESDLSSSEPAFEMPDAIYSDTAAESEPAATLLSADAEFADAIDLQSLVEDYVSLDNTDLLEGTFQLDFYAPGEGGAFEVLSKQADALKDLLMEIGIDDNYPELSYTPPSLLFENKYHVEIYHEGQSRPKQHDVLGDPLEPRLQSFERRAEEFFKPLIQNEARRLEQPIADFRVQAVFNPYKQGDKRPAIQLITVSPQETQKLIDILAQSSQSSQQAALSRVENERFEYRQRVLAIRQTV